jgi:hypothetical protein
MYRSRNRSKGGWVEHGVTDSEGAMTANIGTYHPHVIKEAIETVKRTWSLNCEDKDNFNKEWSYGFSSKISS